MLSVKAFMGGNFQWNGVAFMEIKRDSYLQQLISYRFDGLVKVITGIRRCGKSYLLKKIYRDYLIQNGVKEEQIISIELDLAKDIKYRNPLILSSYVREMVEKSKEEFYLFIDEIQMSDEVANPYNPDGKKITFYDALNDLRGLANLDVYVTGSNSKIQRTGADYAYPVLRRNFCSQFCG